MVDPEGEGDGEVLRELTRMDHNKISSIFDLQLLKKGKIIVKKQSPGDLVIFNRENRQNLQVFSLWPVEYHADENSYHHESGGNNGAFPKLFL